MSTSQSLLAFLEVGPAHGYTLKRRYDETFTYGRPLASGQVYAALASFEKRGLARMLEVQPGAGPERKVYEITPKGVTTVDEWVARPEPPTVYSVSDLFAKVSVALFSGRSATAVLAAQREEHLTRMRVLTRLRPTAGPADMLAITYELNHLDADLRWIEEAGQRLKELGQGVDRG